MPSATNLPCARHQLAAAAGVSEMAVWFFDGTGDIPSAWWALMAAFKSGRADFTRVLTEHHQLHLNATRDAAFEYHWRRLGRI
jgi:hypothetical protein